MFGLFPTSTCSYGISFWEGTCCKSVNLIELVCSDFPYEKGLEEIKINFVIHCCFISSDKRFGRWWLTPICS